MQGTSRSLLLLKCKQVAESSLAWLGAALNFCNLICTQNYRDLLLDMVRWAVMTTLNF